MSKFRNVIFCEDIREEIGNKKSLMGVIGGDLLVSVFPTAIRVAAFFEYLADPEEKNIRLNIRLLQDETEVGKAEMFAEIKEGASRHVNFALPQGFLTFEKAASFRILATVNNGEEEEILSRKIMLATSS